MTPQARQRQRVRAPVLAVCAGAWVVLAIQVLARGGGADRPIGPQGLSPGASLHSQHADALASHAGHPSSPAAIVVGWTVMLLAMMGPLLIPALRHVAERSLPRRRGRSVTLMVVAYLATWAVGLVVLAATSTLIRQLVADPLGAAALGLTIALVWQVSPAKQRCLNRCHARPSLAAFGRAADLDALRYGRRQAQWCFGSCWALMLVPLLLASHHLTAMLLVALWLWAERFEPPAPLAWRVRVPLTVGRIMLARARAVVGAPDRPRRRWYSDPVEPVRGSRA